mgnify:CR=1 FL=1|jgi:sugar/nucleoside kinase (ribokinase family)
MDAITDSLHLTQAHKRISQISRTLLQPSSSSSSSSSSFSKNAESVTKEKTIVCIGACVFDIQCYPSEGYSLEVSTSVPGKCESKVGGVARNVCESLAALVGVSSKNGGSGNSNGSFDSSRRRRSDDGSDRNRVEKSRRRHRVRIKMVSTVGDDENGRLMKTQLERLGVDASALLISERSERTSTVVAIMDRGSRANNNEKELHACVADVREIILDRRRVEDVFASGVDFVMCDANLTIDSLKRISEKMTKEQLLWFEPTSVVKSVKILDIVGRVDLTSPNQKELREMANALRRKIAPGSPPSPCPFNPELKFETAQEALDSLAGDLQVLHAHGVKVVYLTLGALGVILSFSPINGATIYAHIPAAKINSEDGLNLVGAGDAFVSGTMFVLAELLKSSSPSSSSSMVSFSFDDLCKAAVFGTKVASICVETSANALGGSTDKLEKLFARENKFANDDDTRNVVEIMQPVISAYP